MVSIGIVGLGFMGMTHYRGIRQIQGVEVAAICTRDPKKRAGDWRGVGGNFGAPGGIEDLAGIRTYEKIDDLLSDEAIDLVDICLPTARHCDVAIAAMRAGKHVLVEKPIALSLEDADRMVRVSEQTGRLMMVAQVLPFFPEFAHLKQVVEGGEYGEVLGAHFKRVISQPNWSSAFADMEKSGGPGVDLHIHDTHYIMVLLGRPDRVVSSGRLVRDRYVEYLFTNYQYDHRPELCVTCASGAISQRGRAFAHGFEVYLERATALYEFSTLRGKPVVTTPMTLLTDDGEVREPNLGDGDPVVAFAREIQAAAHAVETGEVARELSGKNAADALRLCFAEVEAVKRRCAVSV